jgi:hypothetical protein
MPANDVPSDIPMSDISADVSPGNRIAINSSAAIEVTGTVHSMERPTLHAGKTAAVESAAATKASAAPPSVGMGEKGGEANKGGKNKYQDKLETGFHDARLPNL